MGSLGVRWRGPLLLALYFALTIASVASVRPYDEHGELLPVGLGAGVLLAASRAAWRHLLPLLWAATVAGYLLGGAPLATSLTWGTLNALGQVVLARWLRRRQQRPSLHHADGFLAYLAAAATVSVGVGLAMAASASALTSDPVLVVGVGAVLANLSSYLILLPFFLDIPAHPAVAGMAERLAQGAVLLGVTLGAFWLDPRAAWVMALALIPVLGWAALRLSVRDLLRELLVVATVVNALTMSRYGPFGSDTGGDALGDWAIPALQLFVVCCALSTLPFALAVGWHRSAAGQAAAEADKLQRLVDSATGVAIVGTDPAGRITLFNPGAASMLGYRSEEVLGRSPAMFHRPEEIRRLAAELGVDDDIEQVATALSLPGSAAVEVEYLRRDGTPRIHSVSVSALRGADGRFAGFVSTGEDVTERVETQRALQLALEKEHDAVEQLLALDRDKDDFVSSVSHELRTPLTSILGYLELIEDGDYGELTREQRDALGRVTANSRRLLILVDDLLTLSRLREGAVEPERTELDLRRVVSAACEVVSPTARSAGLDFTAQVPDEPVPFLGDPEQLERVLVNLLGNAVKFTPRGGSVHTELSRRDRVAVLTVRDTGLGIPDQDQQALFTRFFRSSVARAHAIQGSGLGLAIAQAIVELHGGSIEVTSAAGRGSEFRVLLPA